MLTTAHRTQRRHRWWPNYWSRGLITVVEFHRRDPEGLGRLRPRHGQHGRHHRQLGDLALGRPRRLATHHSPVGVAHHVETVEQFPCYESAGSFELSCSDVPARRCRISASFVGRRVSSSQHARGFRPLLSGRPIEESAVRWLVCHRGANYGDLLPTQLPGATAARP